MTNTEEKNFGLTEAAFKDLQNKLSTGDEQLFELIFLRHFEPCLQYVVNEDNAPQDVAYDATMDAFLTFRMKVAQGKINYGNLRYLLTRMARQHYYKRAKKEQSVSLDLIQPPTETPDIELGESAVDLLQKGWKSLGEKCRKLLHAFYYLNQELKDIAAQTDRKPEALRKQKQRCVAQLRGLVVTEK